ncbi:ABC1 kinase family protein [Leptotrichia buccalis]|uniref:ABC-1 domain protein n=1 Tax=Leptotrichia buccalis (strain ATCC 14201 / DSM 1135 / JCM 12969 / NCTC 10249 / C-1013-b) TaxID=523794 RepID=C7ND75_LEPBD|nr:AarF/UbiB family protein [Leptotrichia buccalis]ACV39953.1 ABC-1 domain protein [Leptotrichia buccalis C-1013-b]
MEIISQKTKRVMKLSGVIAKYGFDELFKRGELEKYIPKNVKRRYSDKIEEINSYTFYERIRMAIEEMGPVHIKFGQMLSNRKDILPEEFIIELQKLQDNVEVEKIDVRKKLDLELGIDVNDYFSEIEENPMASASIGQVFRAKLKTGEKVVIKIQRENIRPVVEADLGIMKNLAKTLEKYYDVLKRMSISEIVESFEKMLNEELSLNNELNNMLRFANNFKNDSRIHVPVVYKTLSNDRILTMEMIEGFKITDAENIIKIGIETKKVARTGLDLYLTQFLKHGFFHADPHPGNIFIKENGQIVFIDFGAMGRLYPNERELLINLIIYSLKKDVKKMIETIRELAVKFEVADEKKFERELYGLIELVDENSLENIDVVTIFEKARKIFSNNQILLSEDIYLLVKGIGQIEGIGRHLDPTLNITKVMRPYMNKITKERMNPINIFKKGISKIETFSDNWLTLPTDMKILLEKIQNNELKHKHEIIGFDKFQKAFERLILAIIISSLFVGSSILALANIPPKIFGISGLGLLGFFISGIMGINLFLKSKK